MRREKGLRVQLAKALRWADAHADFEAAISCFPAALRGRKPPGAPHTAWELLEHLRLAQRDILDFCRDPRYAEKRWPEDYWPRTAAPSSPAAWQKSIRQFRAGRRAMERLVLNPETDLFRPIPHGSGQTILREALLLADHNAYHIGQLVLLRRLLGAWPAS
jgi:hypothetical protein